MLLFSSLFQSIDLFERFTRAECFLSRCSSLIDVSLLSEIWKLTLLLYDQAIIFLVIYLSQTIGFIR
jgi:hypothetical protein